jgi:hypothetical protein
MAPNKRIVSVAPIDAPATKKRKDFLKMPVFTDTPQFYSVMTPFFNRLKDDPEIGPKVLASGLIIQFVYSDPDAILTIDCPNNLIIEGQTELTPTVQMSMSSLVAHKFWLGKVNLMVALTKREMIAKGPVAAIMKLLPIIKGAYAMYNEYLKGIGLEDKITNWD